MLQTVGMDIYERNIFLSKFDSQPCGLFVHTTGCEQTVVKFSKALTSLLAGEDHCMES